MIPKDLDAFLPAIWPYAPGCPNITAFAAIRLAAIEFCERTKLWRWEDDFDILANDAEAITTPYGSVLHEIDKVLFNGNELERKTPSWLDDFEPGWRTNSITSELPQYVTQTELNTIRLVPSADGHVNIYVWLKPSADAKQLPDFLSDQYREIIAAGALARLLSQPGQPYSNPTLGAGYAALFEAKVTDMLGRAVKGQQRAPRRTRASMF
jgi:hypothetical protein